MSTRFILNHLYHQTPKNPKLSVHILSNHLVIVIDLGNRRENIFISNFHQHKSSTTIVPPRRISHYLSWKIAENVLAIGFSPLFLVSIFHEVKYWVKLNHHILYVNFHVNFSLSVWRPFGRFWSQSSAEFMTQGIFIISLSEAEKVLNCRFYLSHSLKISWANWEDSELWENQIDLMK